MVGINKYLCWNSVLVSIQSLTGSENPQYPCTVRERCEGVDCHSKCFIVEIFHILSATFNLWNKIYFLNHWEVLFHAVKQWVMLCMYKAHCHCQTRPSCPNCQLNLYDSLRTNTTDGHILFSTRCSTWCSQAKAGSNQWLNISKVVVTLMCIT